ncbi:hypothetical protein EI067_05685 [Mycobacterium paragordonae]|jgi:hypothetical protein|uniref:hypothetical protein n=1 Tax=Mycobacterium paragordonae TaxID=1389713 RepID=UPI000A8156E4|nr:hypothetical protein [Mycobacterium paragordonae]TDK98977.1 hypothetical protein EI067_05685 [Mycobacterium paragordonae]
MTVPRRVVSVAVFAGWLAFGPAGIASADPAMSGHYISTVTSASGETTTSDWYFTPCGAGCASVANSPGGPGFGEARMFDGQWTLAWHSDAVCSSGTRVPGAYASYASWDPITLEGKNESGITRPVCGSDKGLPRVTQHLGLTQAG